MATPEKGAGTISDPRERREVAACLIHASAVCFLGKGLLLLGASNSGKSDLALRLIDAGGVLIADDQVRLSRLDDRLHAGPPKRLAGLIALRGIGILRVPFEEAVIDLAVDLVASGAADDPLPDAASVSWLGVHIPKISMQGEAPSAVARIRMALQAERVF